MGKGKIAGLFTDAPKHNLALMRISSWLKQIGFSTVLNEPISYKYDVTYASWLFTKSKKTPADIVGGVAIYPDCRLSTDIQNCKPDYDLFNIDCSLGYTWDYCPRKCEFCIVPNIYKEKRHHSIWNFHDTRFNKICLLNNNTFSDLKWIETFEEIWDANLAVVDQNGYDARLLDDEKASCLKKTKFASKLHFAWDLMRDEIQVLRGLNIAKSFNLQRVVVYVLIGFNTTIEEDLYRCQKVHDLKFDPYIMSYNRGSKLNRKFKRFIDARYYRKYKTIEEAWKDYGQR